MTRKTDVHRLSGAAPRPRPPLSAQRVRVLRQRWQGRRRAMLAALLPTLAMMIGATVSLSAKAAPRTVDPYTDGARATAAGFDVFTEGASRVGPRDSFTQGGHGPDHRDRFTDGAHAQESPADHSA
ncbi:hypothetical protein L602_000800001230 [Cupriavidus gilardii J11]|uniref:Uncharacterized protein n=1 Tax=Cupriavidus gilardii J11 TaxID=936133 RepID=A0A562B1W0_9BURK|nr:hypothetical protein [Cupriavidus gilardii]TWG79054.1 hypothetical protein L602_000800001230 [Cupriavidus gilardii J11]